MSSLKVKKLRENTDKNLFKTFQIYIAKWTNNVVETNLQSHGNA